MNYGKEKYYFVQDVSIPDFVENLGLTIVAGFDQPIFVINLLIFNSSMHHRHA